MLFIRLGYTPTGMAKLLLDERQEGDCFRTYPQECVNLGEQVAKLLINNRFRIKNKISA
jgi:hypothetical protein